MPIVRDNILDVLTILQMNLQTALDELQTIPGDADFDNVVVGNIAFADNGNNRQPDIANRIVITLLKTEEEYALKNQPAYRRHPVTGNLEQINPPVSLNLHVMVTANNPDYHRALSFLSRTIGYLQYQRVFTETNSDSPAGILRYNFNINMMSPGFEQLNHIWGIMGGKHLPSVFYKLQLTEIQYVPDEPQLGDVIREIVVNEQIV
jgi:hypothetical protein